MEEPKQGGRWETIGTVASGLVMAAPRTGAYGIRAAVRPFRGSRKHPEIAPQLPTPRLLASVFVDHVAMSALQTVFTAVEDYDLAELRREVDTTIERLDARGWLQDPRGFHRLPPAPVDPVLEPARWLHFRYERLSFESGYVSPVEAERADERWNAPPNRTVHAYVLRHRDSEPHPWVLLQHGYGAGMPMDFYMGAAHFHRDLGFNVIGPIAPYHGPRRVFRRGGVGMTSLDYVRNLHSLGQAVWDIRGCISWAETQGAGPMACYGVSMGGCLVGLIAGIDDRVGTAVVGIPVVDMAAKMRSHALGDRWGESERTGLFGDCLELIHRPVTPLTLPPLVPHERRFIYAGVGDQISTPGDAYRLWQHWDRPNVLWFEGSHLTASGKVVKQFVDDALLSHAGMAPAQISHERDDEQVVSQAL
jgi:predicted alpha/beta hydrolase